MAAQYHSQDDFGQYSYGYSNEDSFKNEHRTADGIVRGSYSYIDANEKLQVVHYISDALGFRVSATNLPKHDVDSIAEPIQEPVVEELALDIRKGKTIQEPIAQGVPISYAPNYAYAPSYTYSHSAPTHVVPNPSSQFHSQVYMILKWISTVF